MSGHERRLIASVSKSIAMMCVRNTILEDTDAGSEPVSRIGDFTEVMVIDASGRHVPLAQVPRIGDEEMGHLMRQAVNRLYTSRAKADNQHIVAMMDRALVQARRWDEQELDAIIPSAMASRCWRVEGGNENGHRPC